MKLLTLDEARAQLGISRDTLYRRVAARKIACVRETLGPGAVRRTRGRIKFRQEDVDAYLARHRVAAETENRSVPIARAALRDVMPPVRRFGS